MDTAHLTHAHEHARNAASATCTSDFHTALVEHELAAAEFQQATKETENSEALRILGLLESHHQRLATIIKVPAARKSSTVKQETDTPSTPVRQQSPDRVAASASTSPNVRGTSPAPSKSPPARALSRRRLPRDHTSSIANSLATARGIPGHRSPSATSPLTVTGALAARAERQSRADQGKTSQEVVQRQPPKIDTGKAEEASRSPNAPNRDENQSRAAPASPTDDGFKRFYATLGSVLSNIPASLAFTALPLGTNSSSTSAPPAPEPSKSRSPEASRVTAKPDDLDLSALISKPALRALKDDRGVGVPFGNTESFYVVPTSGGTVSYANILAHPQSHGHHHAAQNPNLPDVDEEGSDLRGSSHDEFVDARDTPYPPSPTAPRHPRKSSKAAVTTTRNIPAGRGYGRKTMEEMQLENDTLKELLDKQSKRLQMWEATSQSSYSALAQSFRVRGGLKQQMSDPSALAQALSMGTNATPPVPSIPDQFRKTTTDASADNSTKASDLEKRIKELEAMTQEITQRAEQSEKDKEMLERQNKRHVEVLAKYREQWEKLKAGARKKEKERRERNARESLQGVQEEVEGEVENSDVGDAAAAQPTEDANVIVDEVEEPGFGKA